MTMPRVHEIAKDLGISSKAVLNRLNQMGDYVRGPSSTLEERVVRRLRANLRSDPPTELEKNGLGPSAEPPTQAIPTRVKRKSPGSGYTAGSADVHVSRGQGLWGTYRDLVVPKDALVHAVKAAHPRTAPHSTIFLKAGAREMAWCGAEIRALLPHQFDAGKATACPDCLDVFIPPSSGPELS